jgi:hypothetical protein
VTCDVTHVTHVTHIFEGEAMCLFKGRRSMFCLNKVTGMVLAVVSSVALWTVIIGALVWCAGQV